MGHEAVRIVTDARLTCERLAMIGRQRFDALSEALGARAPKANARP